LREAYDKTLESWAKLVEYRDQDTKGHSDRVVEMCTILAQEIGLPQAKITHMRRGALLHDIGKMVIPDEILFKKGALDENEWVIMREHPVIAKSILSEVKYLEPALNIPSSHHERWDGSGYPSGLKGEDIQIEVRIFTLVDQWDALNSDRPYREAWPQDKIVAYIKENSNKIFDPSVTKVFFHLLERGDFDDIKY
jgi:putative nucleotidyltransferase with HDIG domain